MPKIMFNNTCYSKDGSGSEIEELTKKVDEVDGKVVSLSGQINSKVNNFNSGNYKAVTGLAYDSTSKKLGLKVGADTIIPFSGYKPMGYIGQTNNGSPNTYTFPSNYSSALILVCSVTGGGWYWPTTLTKNGAQLSAIHTRGHDVGNGIYSMYAFYLIQGVNKGDVLRSTQISNNVFMMIFAN